MRLFITLSVMAKCVFASVAIAQGGGDVRYFHVEETTAGAALIAFAEQADLQLLFPYEYADETDVNFVIGQYTTYEALSLLLRGSNFSGGLEEGGILVVSLRKTVGLDREEEMASGKLKKLLLAGVAAFVLGGGDAVLAQDRVEDEKEKDKDAPEEIVVTGTTIRGVYPDSAPLDVYTAEDIALSGATTLERFLETLPQNVNNLGAATAILGPGEGSNFARGGGADLRGLGVGTTLVLLNGRRLTSPDGESPDTSLIPLGAVERVEILTDGASAIYGSDAIAGVVNFVLRDDFEGVNASASYGSATRGGHDRMQADLAAGTSWGSGSGFISYSHSTQSSLAAGERDFASSAPDPASLVPNELKHSVFGSINQDITDRLRLFGNAFYSTRNSDLNSTSTSFDVVSNADQSQIFLSGGLEYEISNDLYFQFDSTYVQYELTRFFNNRTLDGQSIRQEEGDSLDLLTKLDGALIDLPGGEAKFSIGGGYLKQDFQADIAIPSVPFDFDFFDRESYFAFGEVFLPLASEDQNVTGVNRFELSGATRYTEYSDFGGAWTPRVGLLWSPVRGLNLRGTFARSFRAPTLRDLNPNNASAGVTPLAFFVSRGIPDPFSADDSSIMLSWRGGVREGLLPEFADTMTLGFDFRPNAIPRLKVSATYYNIDYTDRLGSLGTFDALRDPEGFGFAFNPSPTLADFEQIVASLAAPDRFFDSRGLISDTTDPAAIAEVVTVIFDNRRDNLASSKAEGFDVSLGYGHESPVGDLNYGVRLTKTLTSAQRAFPDSPETSRLDTIGNPVSLRLNGYAGLRRGGFSGQINVIYIDSYTNTTVVPEEPIDSWTTVDLSLRYDFGDSSSSLLRGAMTSVSVNNLFDADPPFVARRTISGSDGLLRGGGFDPVNANAVGRFVTIGLTKQF